MNSNYIAQRRLISQHIGGTLLQTPAAVVSHMGAMQAQDFNMVKWAIGARLPGSTEEIIEKSFNAGAMIRTHLMRPTWHLVVPEDVSWLLELTAPRIKSAAKSRHRSLEIDDKLVARSYKLIERALEGNKHLTRDELTNVLENSGIKARNQRLYHLMFCAELDGVVCSGEIRNKEQTYALLRERVPEIKKVDRDEALALLARKYFTSHSPASVSDFAWWSGLSLGDCRRAIELIRPDFISDKAGEITYWFPHSASSVFNSKESVHLLPAFDEYIIAYRDRSASLVFEHHKKAVSNNGIFRPVIVINGLVKGIWKRTIKKDVAVLEMSLFHPLNKKEMRGIEKAGKRYGEYLDHPVGVVAYHPDGVVGTIENYNL
jgi:hypothetical protein